MKPFSGQLRWVLIAYAFLMSAMSYLERVNLSIAGPTLQKEFRLTDVELGYVFSAFVWSYAFFQAPSGRIADRFGPRWVLTFGILWWSACTAVTGFAPEGSSVAVPLLIAIRLALGAGEAVMFPTANRLVASWIPMAERGIATGIILGGVGIGSAVSPPLIIWIILNWGWRWAFYAMAPLGVVSAIVWYWLVRDSPREHFWMTDKELNHIESGIPPSARGGPAKARAASWRIIAGNRHIRYVTLSYFAFGYTAYIFFTWFFKYVKDVRGLDLRASAFWSIFPFVGITLGSAMGGWVSDLLSNRFGKRVGRCGIAIAGLVGSALFIIFATQVESAELASILFGFGTGALFMGHSSYWSVTADIAGTSAGSASGLMNTAAHFAGAITAILTPLIAGSLGWTASFLVPASLCFLGAVPWLFVDPTDRLATH
jgi:ACS family glucarate transporter-like MFS transporter